MGRLGQRGGMGAAKLGWDGVARFCSAGGKVKVWKWLRNSKTHEKRRMQMKIKLGNLKRGSAGFWC